MELHNIIAGAQYLEFINLIDETIFELLYSNDEGYVNLSSKEALKEFDNYLLKFKNETEKIALQFNFKEKEEIIKAKFRGFSTGLKKHYEKEAINYFKEMLSDRIENCLCEVSINEGDTKKQSEIYSQCLVLINRICEIENFNTKEKRNLINDFNLRFNEAKNTNSNLYQNKITETDPKRFVELYFSISNDTKNFVSVNLDDEKSLIDKEDLFLFKQKQRNLQNYKKTNTLDEVDCIIAAINLLNLKDDKDKYSFIKQVEDDFNLFVSTNKKIEDTDKIEIIKKRLNLFNKKERDNRFKKILTRPTVWNE